MWLLWKAGDAVDNWEKFVLEIFEDNAFEREVFWKLQGVFARYDSQKSVEKLIAMLQKQYVSIDVETMLVEHGKEEIIDFLNRLILSKLNYNMRYNVSADLITAEELEEFMTLAEQTNKVSKENLSKNAEILTTQSYLNMCRVVYDATSNWKYPCDISTAYLFCEARLFDFNHEYDFGILGIDWDSPEQFADRFNNSYHREELEFGGLQLYIRDENSKIREKVYAMPTKYKQWTGYTCCYSYDIMAICQVIKMYNALRKKNYPIYFLDYEKAYKMVKESL